LQVEDRAFAANALVRDNEFPFSVSLRVSIPAPTGYRISSANA
jgi:hypothetical protein